MPIIEFPNYKFKAHLQILSVFILTDGEGNGTPFQHSCLENPMDGGAWWAAVHGVAKVRTWLSNFTFTFHFHALEKEMTTNPLQCSYLENPRDGGAWWAVIYGVAQSLTWLKRLSSSSSMMTEHGLSLIYSQLLTEYQTYPAHVSNHDHQAALLESDKIPAYTLLLLLLSRFSSVQLCVTP